MELFLHSFQLLRGEDGPGWLDQFLALVILFFSPNLILFDFRRLLLPSLRKSSAKNTWLNRFLQIWPLAKIFHVCRVDWLFVNNWLVKNFDLHIDLHHSYHWHQRCWSLSGMSAMWGHRPILFPPLTNVVCAQHNVFVIVCIAALCRSTRGALSS